MQSMCNSKFADNSVASLPSPALTQDIHISCPQDLVAAIIAELHQQFAEVSNVEVYDWGWSCRFKSGYIVLTWRGCVDPAFEKQLETDPRLLGHSIYYLSESLTESGPVVVTNRVSGS